MGVMFDAVNWRNLLTMVGAKAGYDDGPESQWPAEAWTELEPGPFVHITVLANPGSLAFDLEQGNAPLSEIMAAMETRRGAGLPSVLYCGRNAWEAAAPVLRGTPGWPTHPKYWPGPFTFLWAADPTGTLHSRPAWAPVLPIACQSIWAGGYDVSYTVDPFPGVRAPQPPPGPEPQPQPTPNPLRKEIVMPYIIQVNEGAGNGTAATTDGVSKKHILDPADLKAYQAAGLVTVGVTQAEYDTYPGVS